VRIESLASAARRETVAVALHGTPEAWTGVIRGAGGSELVRAEARG
jgi:hypothetical protein